LGSLILATFFSASIALLFKYSAMHHLNQRLITVTNYATATFISAFLIIQNQNENLGTTQLLMTCAIGFATGVFFLLSFSIYQKSVKQNGASISGMFAKLGILIPMIISIVIWNEIPSYVQTLGIVVAMTAIVIANMSSKKEQMILQERVVKEGSGRLMMLLGLFMVGGFAEFLNKIFQRLVSLDYKPIFLFVVFVTAFLLSLILYLKSEHKPQKKGHSLLVGSLIGIPNLFASFFLLNALDVFPAAIVFPAYSAGSILLISVLSVILFKETLYKKDVAAIGLTMVSLVLLNL
jgi:drug/metabolite transporter (DMT)-like permease